MKKIILICIVLFTLCSCLSNKQFELLHEGSVVVDKYRDLFEREVIVLKMYNEKYKTCSVSKYIYYKYEIGDSIIYTKN